MKEHNYLKILVIKKGMATEIEKKMNDDIVKITTGKKLPDNFIDSLVALKPVLLEALDLEISHNKAYCNGVVFKKETLALKGYYYHSKTLEQIDVVTPDLPFTHSNTNGIVRNAGAFDYNTKGEILKCWSFYTQQLVENLIDETELLISNKVSQLSLLSNEDFYEKKVESEYKEYNEFMEKNIKLVNKIKDNINEKTGIKSITFSSKNDSVTIGEHIN